MKKEVQKSKFFPKKPPRDLMSYQSAFLNDKFVPEIGDIVYLIRDHRHDKQESLCIVKEKNDKIILLADETLGQQFMFNTSGPFPNVRTTVKLKKVAPLLHDVSSLEGIQNDVSVNEETESGTTLVNISANTN